MSIEDKYKPFWEEKDNSQSSPSENLNLDNSAEESLSKTSKEGRDTLKIDASREETESFMEYLAREKNRKPRQKIEVVDIDTPTSTTINNSAETIGTIVTIIIGIGLVLGISFLIINTIEVPAQINTTEWTNYTDMGVVNNQFLSIFNPVIMFIIFSTLLVILTRRHSIVPFIITFMMSILLILFFNVSILIVLIPGTILIWKSIPRWSMA